MTKKVMGKFRVENWKI